MESGLIKKRISDLPDTKTDDETPEKAGSFLSNTRKLLEDAADIAMEVTVEVAANAIAESSKAALHVTDHTSRFAANSIGHVTTTVQSCSETASATSKLITDVAGSAVDTIQVSTEVAATTVLDTASSIADATSAVVETVATVAEATSMVADAALIVAEVTADVALSGI